jgi:hypothetical protein
MYKKSLFIHTPILLLVPVLLLTHSHAYSQPHGPERDAVRKAAIESSGEVDKLYGEIVHIMKTVEMSGDKEHDQAVLATFQRSHQSWQSYREDYCMSQSYLNVYPSASRMFSSSFNHCTAEENKRRLKKLKSIKYQAEHYR